MYVTSLEEIAGKKGSDLRWQAAVLVQAVFKHRPGGREIRTRDLAQLEALEMALSAEYPNKLLARYFQVIARKA